MQEIIDTLNSILETTKLTADVIREAKKALEIGDKAIKDGQKLFRELSGAKEVDLSIKDALVYVREEAPRVFTDEVETAISKSDEFAYYAFLDPLFQIANDDALYSFLITGKGWGTRITAVLEMDLVAGTINDYAQAVEDTRDSLGVGSGDPEKASKLWRKIYSNRGGLGTYGRTISMRLSSSGERAPFWSLLDKGSVVAMTSNRGGTAYPRSPATRFVDKAEKALERIFTEAMQFMFGENVNKRELLDRQIQELVVLVDKVRALIDDLDDKWETMKKIARELGVSVRLIDPSKLFRVLDEIRQGMAARRPYIGVSGVTVRRASSVIERAATIAGVYE